MRRAVTVVLGLVATVLALAALAGCGPLDDDEPSPPIVGGGPVDVRLTVAVDLGNGFTRAGTVECGDRPLGTGFLAEPGRSTDACRLMALSGEARKRLLLGPERDRVCSQEFGGPQTAMIDGVIDKQPVDTAVDRVDGCGISDWTVLEPLIGQP